MANLSDKEKEIIILQQQYQNVIVELETLKLRNKEIEEIVEELQKSEKTEAYKLIGNVLIKKDKNNLINELKEEKELVELRLKNLEKQKQKLEEKLKEIRKMFESEEKS